jgi:hypothetical protein
MTDPRLIALSSNPGQVEPGPFSEHDLREQWNAQADEFNQWESLDSSEQLAWAQTRAIAAQAAAQAEGPSLDDVVKLCQEFFHIADPNHSAFAIVHEMITAAITRWPAPVAQPAAQPVEGEVNLELMAALIEIQRLRDLRQTLTTTPAPEEPDVGHILRLTAIIREVDGRHSLGAAALAEAILAHPGFSGCRDGPAASAVQGVQADRYEFSVFDSEDCEVAGGIAATLDDAIREGRNYLRQYNQDGPHKLELRRVLVVEWTEDGWHTLSDLTHWQPLPSPPITPSPHA